MLIYKVADVAFSLKTLYPYTQKLLKDYSCVDAPSFDIAITAEDILREKSAGESFPDAYLESLAVYRKLCERMTADFNGFLFHGSAVAVDSEAYIFAAPSGTGKSTHAALWRKVLGSRAVMINDDKPIIRYIDGGFYVYGTPWNGKHGLSVNARARLKAICGIYRSPINVIKKASADEIMPVLLNQSLRPENAADMAKFLDLIEKLVAETGLYLLGCNMDEEAAVLSYEAMSGKKI